MSLSSLFSTAQRSLQAYQAATNATGQNLANVETEGYTRQRVTLRTDPAALGGVVIPQLSQNQGTGVGVGDFARIRSGLLDAAARRGQTGKEGSAESYSLRTTMEGQIAPDGGDALYGAFGAFWDAWSAVADNPAEPALRDGVLAAGEHLAKTLSDADARLQDFGAGVQNEFVTSVGRANEVLNEVAALNERVRTARATGAIDAASEDRRDLLIDELSGLLPIQARPEADGTISVSFNGMVGVQGTTARPLTATVPPDSAVPEVRAAGGTRPLDLDALQGGRIGAQVDLLAKTLPDARGRLDTLAAGLVASVNGLHASGYGSDGGTGRPFFDPAGTTAQSLRVAVTDTSEVAASGAAGQTGDASVATALAGLDETTNTALTSLLARVGTDVATARASQDSLSAAADHAQALRDGVSSVSMDEELANLIRYQQAYAASARVLDTAKTLFDTILAI